MENMMENIIAKNEKKYNDFKGELEGIFKSSNSEYNSMLNDYNSQINYIKNDNGYSAEGKSRENKKINDIFYKKVSSKANEYYDKLISKIDEELNKREKEESESYIDEKDENYYNKKILNEITKQHLNSNMMVQLMYVNSMLNSINSIDDADMLEYVYKYACIDKNFSDEIINMIYLKARNIINAPIEKKEYPVPAKSSDGSMVVGTNETMQQEYAIKLGHNRTKVSKIINDFEKYNYDYLADINNFKKSFLVSKARGNYPGGLYTSIDFKRDFNKNIVGTWGDIKKSNDPWNR
ncbi:hypothetical protein [Clostridium sp. HCS.1]|uniref:hypothetical protein n=1 Tax=Clostridium sp. HCS.1 TaxID=3238594 RepID=UPI003A0FD040